MTGKLHQKNLSSPIQTSIAHPAIEYVMLTLLGAIAITAHSKLRMPLNIPGHHGIEFMMLLLIGRQASKLPWASSISSLGIGIALLFPVWGFSDPFMGFNYLLPGILLDLAFHLNQKRAKNFFFIILAGGVSYMTIPLSRAFISLLSGYVYKSFLKHGIFTSVASHFLFGTIGAALGTGIAQIKRKK